MRKLLLALRLGLQRLLQLPLAGGLLLSPTCDKCLMLSKVIQASDDSAYTAGRLMCCLSK